MSHVCVALVLVFPWHGLVGVRMYIMLPRVVLENVGCTDHGLFQALEKLLRQESLYWWCSAASEFIAWASPWCPGAFYNVPVCPLLQQLLSLFLVLLHNPHPVAPPWPMFMVWGCRGLEDLAEYIFPKTLFSPALGQMFSRPGGVIKKDTHTIRFIVAMERER